MPRRKVRKPAVEVEVLDPIDPNEDFSDVSGDPGNGFRLENPRPDRAYLWAHSSQEGIGDAQSNVVPYVVEFYLGDDDPEAVRPVGTLGFFKKGDRILVRDHVLMSCDRAKLEKRSRYLIQRNRETWRGKKRWAEKGEIQADEAAASLAPGVAAALRSRAPMSTHAEME